MAALAHVEQSGCCLAVVLVSGRSCSGDICRFSLCKTSRNISVTFSRILLSSQAVLLMPRLSQHISPALLGVLYSFYVIEFLLYRLPFRTLVFTLNDHQVSFHAFNFQLILTTFELVFHEAFIFGRQFRFYIILLQTCCSLRSCSATHVPCRRMHSFSTCILSCSMESIYLDSLLSSAQQVTSYFDWAASLFPSTGPHARAPPTSP